MKNLKNLVNADGTGKVNWKGVAYYNRLINYLIEKGKGDSYDADIFSL